jgi:hypothetical protein
MNPDACPLCGRPNLNPTESGWVNQVYPVTVSVMYRCWGGPETTFTSSRPMGAVQLQRPEAVA